MSTAITIPVAPPRFDYSVLDQDTAHAVMRATDSIQVRKHSIDCDIIGIGTDLLSVKARLNHGQFGKWIEAEFSMTPRTAQNYMRVAEVIGPKYETVSHLRPTTIYALAGPSVPAEVRERVVEAERLPDSTVKMMIAEALQQDARAKRRRALKESREAQLRPESPRTLRKQERERQQDEEARQRREVAMAQVVALVLDTLGDRLPALLDLLSQIGPGGIWRLPDELQKSFAGRNGDAA
jgi:hypothetical protein